MIKGLISWLRHNTKFIFPEHNLVEAQATAKTDTNKNKKIILDYYTKYFVYTLPSVSEEFNSYLSS